MWCERDDLRAELRERVEAHEQEIREKRYFYDRWQATSDTAIDQAILHVWTRWELEERCEAMDRVVHGMRAHMWTECMAWRGERGEVASNVAHCLSLPEQHEHYEHTCGLDAICDALRAMEPEVDDDRNTR